MKKYIKLNEHNVKYINLCILIVLNICKINKFNSLKFFWLILGQRKTSLVILFLMANNRPLEIIMAKKTTDLILLFHKNIINS